MLTEVSCALAPRWRSQSVTVEKPLSTARRLFSVESICRLEVGALIRYITKCLLYFVLLFTLNIYLKVFLLFYWNLLACRSFFSLSSVHTQEQRELTLGSLALEHKNQPTPTGTHFSPWKFWLIKSPHNFGKQQNQFWSLPQFITA